MRWSAQLLVAIVLSGCSKLPYCHCDLPDQCAQIQEDCIESNITCKVESAVTPGLEGKCSVRGDAVGVCVVGSSLTLYYYASGYTSASADADCDGSFTPLPRD